MRLRIVLGVITLGGMTGAACSSSSSTASGQYTGPQTTECSNGPRREESPPYGSPTSTRALPNCIPRCGEAMLPGTTGDSRYSIAALPSGACANEDEACQMAAGNVTTCPEFGSAVCNLSGFECRCESGTWQCITTSQGGGLCACDADAAVQADAAASADARGSD